RVQNEGMKSRRPAVSPEDQALFMAALGGVKPLDKRDRIPVPPPPPSPVRVVEPPAEVALVVEGDSARYTARAPGVSKQQVAELRAGKHHAEATLDLHGQTVEAGRQQLREHLMQAQKLGRRCILVIHGKGTHSEHGAPLREAVLGELLGPLSGLVHAMATAAPADGGEGATYVLVRSVR
ncbi:MAG TPA: Smr/MutS family protein, partial [Kofleriaceae bacterium]